MSRLDPPAVSGSGVGVVDRAVAGRCLWCGGVRIGVGVAVEPPHVVLPEEVIGGDPVWVAGIVVAAERGFGGEPDAADPVDSPTGPRDFYYRVSLTVPWMNYALVP